MKHGQVYIYVVIAAIGHYRSVGVIVRCLVLKQPDCMSLIVEASRSIFARDGPELLKAVTTWQRASLTPDVGTWQAVIVC